MLDVDSLSIGVVVALVVVVVTFLVQRLNGVQMWNARLTYALGEGNREEVLSLLEQTPLDATLDGGDHKGQKLIHLATVLGDVDIIAKLLQRPPKALISVHSVVEETGNTPLHLAALHGRRQVVQSLLDHGAEVNSRNREGWTPLHIASMKGRHQVKEVLLAARADPALLTRSGMSSFELQEREKVHYSETRGWMAPEPTRTNST
jgi:ankyrin repeat protein